MVEYFSFFLGGAFSLIGYKTIKIVNKIYPYIFSKSYLETINSKSLKIAVICGSTDGLGKSFVQRLHKNNFNMILLGRSENKLQEVIKEFDNSKNESQKSNLSPYVVDFSQFKLSSSLTQLNQITSLLEQKINTEQVSKYDQIKLIFINSCGDAHISRYQDTNSEEIQRVQSVNINSFHFLLQVFNRLRSIETLLKVNVPKQYAFIHVSSGVDQNPNLYSSIYSGSKAYCSNVMKVIDAENKAEKQPKNTQETVHFLNLTPLYIKTKMIRYLNQWDVMQPQKIVDGSFKLLKRKSQGAGSIMHQLLKQFPFVMNKTFQQRVNKALQYRNRMIQIQNRRKNRKKKDI